jgi:hypothetical protein
LNTGEELEGTLNQYAEEGWRVFKIINRNGGGGGFCIPMRSRQFLFWRKNNN